MASNQWSRIEEYCKIIWGADRSYHIEDEKHDGGYYFMVIKEDRGTSLGNPLTTTGMIRGSARAWDELEKHVAGLAKAVETEGWVPTVQPLDDAAYPGIMHNFDAMLEVAKSILQK